ncbi:peroxisome assembly protein 26 [Lingula anatina]|uniref:Peroxisome assembly protein 26 n=1 Tax=Lingula anatina TaxID=7574 RepID=A0A1S3JDM3_LINAN|nr:peroxisome assembly protein 26 [Lingula anatina]|eukprot:XP_013408271.1 peroxisome assembly protein 26 [Lingula anatina]
MAVAGAVREKITEQKEKYCSFPTKIDIARKLKDAGDLLIYKRFEDCLDLCQEVVDEVNNLGSGESSSIYRESCCMLAVQAYAELNKWEEVLPYVTALYAGIEGCPARIVQLCILLHSRVQDFTTCSAIASIWLKLPENHKDPLYAAMADTLVQFVLVPQGRWDSIEPFLNTCLGLEKTQKEGLLSKYQKRKQVLDRRKAQEEEDREKSTFKQQDPRSNVLDVANSATLSQHVIIQLWKYLYHSRPTLPMVLVIAVIMTAVLVKRCNKGSGWTKPGKMFISFVATIWRRLFAPYHLAR